MVETVGQWLPVLVFLIFFAGAMTIEGLWLVRSRWATPGRAVLFVLLTNIGSTAVGSVIFSILFFVMFMLAMGPSGMGGTTPEAVYVALAGLAIIVPPAIIIIFKRVSLALLAIRSGPAAWIYSTVAGVIFLILTLIPPVVAYNVLASISL